MAAVAVRAPVSGDMLVQIAAMAAGLFAAWWLYNKAKGAASSAFDSLADLPGTIADKVREYGAGIADAVSGAAGAVVDTAAEIAAPIRAAAPGAGLPTGWYTVKTWQGPIVTQYPDRYKSLNRWDSVLVDP